VSTGIARYDTPSGEFKPFRMEKDHFSKEWDDAPMPYSIFFTMKGHAIHGTNHTSIGRPASHGCVRLSVQHAAILWGLVKHEKMANTRVVLDGRIPGAAAPLVARGDSAAQPVNPNAIVQPANPDVAARPAYPYVAGQPVYPEANGDDAAGLVPQPRQVVRGWRQTRDGPRYYYYRVQPQPYYAPRYSDEAPPPPPPPQYYYYGR
jgi:hypothetical protein